MVTNSFSELTLTDRTYNNYAREKIPGFLGQIPLEGPLPPITRSLYPLYQAALRITHNPRVSLFLSETGFDVLNNFRTHMFVNAAHEPRGMIFPYVERSSQLGYVVIAIDNSNHELITLSSKQTAPKQTPMLSARERGRGDFQMQSMPASISYLDQYRAKISAIIGEDNRQSLPILVRTLKANSTYIVEEEQWQLANPLPLNSLPLDRGRRFLIKSEFDYAISWSVQFAQTFGGDCDWDLFNDSKMLRDFQQVLFFFDQNICKKTLRSLACSINSQVFSELQNSNALSSREFNFANAGESSISQIRRARWISSFPEFITFKEVPELENAIDNGEQTVTHLAEHFGVETGVIKKFKCLPLEVHNGLGNQPIEKLIAFFSQCSIGQIPEFKKLPLASLESISRVIDQTTRFTEMVSNDTNCCYQIAGRMIKNVGKNWESASKQATCQPTKDIGDFLSTWNKRSFAPALYLKLKELQNSPDPPNNAIQAIFNSDRTLRYNKILEVSHTLLIYSLSHLWHIGQFAQASERWHKTFGQNATHQHSSLNTRYLAWPALCPQTTAPNGCVLVPLTSSSYLSQEGALMKHCVGGYASECLTGKTHIFSIQDALGNHLSTLQIDAIRSNVIKIAQNRSHANRAAPTKAAEAANWLISEIISGKIVVDWSNIKQAARNSALSNKVINSFGFDPLNTKLWHDAWKEFIPYAPKQTSSNDPMEFLKALIQNIHLKNCRLDEIYLESLKLLSI